MGFPLVSRLERTSGRLNEQFLIKKPFSNFKQALSDMPAIREQWFSFHDAHTRKKAEAWLKDQAIQAKLK